MARPKRINYKLRTTNYKPKAHWLRCPSCGRPLKEPAKSAKSLKCASCKSSFPVRHGIPVLLPKTLPSDIRLSIDRWNKFYARMSKEAFDASLKEYQDDYLEDTKRQLFREINKKTQKRYLEIGCGPGFLGLDLGTQGFKIHGVDFCVEALALAQRYYRGARIPLHLAGGDLHHMPLADNSIDFLYGGGVIEHFDDTLGALKELRRVLAPGGVSFNTVPYVSVGTFTYRQIWGNIPNLPLIKPLFKFIHMKLLGGKHMTYGYELSFTAAQMIRLHKQAGFREVKVQRFEVYLPFYFLPAFLRPAARILAKWRPFWPMISIVAKK